MNEDNIQCSNISAICCLPCLLIMVIFEKSCMACCITCCVANSPTVHYDENNNRENQIEDLQEVVAIPIIEDLHPVVAVPVID